MAATCQPLDPSPIHGTFQIIAVSASALPGLRLRFQLLRVSTCPVSRAPDQGLYSYARGHARSVPLSRSSSTIRSRRNARAAGLGNFRDRDFWTTEREFKLIPFWQAYGIEWQGIPYQSTRKNPRNPQNLQRFRLQPKLCEFFRVDNLHNIE